MIQPQDVHSFSEPARALVKHLNWDVTIDFDEQQISCVAHLTIEVAADAEQPLAYLISSAWVGPFMVR